jgi:L-seryl-tRNA(Ser) seleniumtransferase
MIAAPVEQLQARATSWRDVVALPGGVVASVEPAQSTIGGGSLPGETLPTCALALQSTRRSSSWASATAARLRAAPTPVVARIEADRVLLDPRTVLPDQDDAVVQALDEAFSFQQSAVSR